MPGHRAKNSVKNNRRMDIELINKFAKVQLKNNNGHRPLIIEYEVGNYVWDVWRVSHAFEDQTKNLNHHGTRLETKYYLARRNSPKNNHIY